MEPYLLQFHPQQILNPSTGNCQKLNNLFEAAFSSLANSRGDSMTEEREKPGRGGASIKGLVLPLPALPEEQIEARPDAECVWWCSREC